ncbi:penicillin acylase family protein, partial [Escherichia coli]|nr:penicillin acylase family protein [Escherichia coli]
MKTLRLAILLISAAIIPLLHAEALAQGETLHLTGLKGKVTVYRDQRSIPYIQAENDEDLYLAQGFVTASDRLWQ